jgi:hypothetical protein
MTHSPSLWSFTVQWVLHSPRLLRASRVPPRRIRGSGRGIPGGSFRGVVFYSLVLMDLFSGSGAFAGWVRHSWWQLSTAVVTFGAVGCIDHERNEWVSCLTMPHISSCSRMGSMYGGNRWRHMDHLQCLLLTNFGYMAHPLGTI